MTSFAILNGPKRTMRRLFAADRAVFSAGYIGSLGTFSPVTSTIQN